MSLTYEICIDSTAGAVAAEKAGAHRVELCSALFDGGLTPTLGAVEATLAAVSSIRVHAIIRPRGGDFIYDEYEIAAMERDVAAVRDAGVQGVVIGALTPAGEVDVAVAERLIGAAEGLSVTFHRAFDMTADPFAALDTLIALGVDRVLTSGQDTTALEGAPLIASLIERAGDRVIVMPGGGITPRNARRVVEATGASELHFAALVDAPSPAVHRNPHPFMGGELRRPEYARLVTSPALVTEVITAAGS
ncbi:copper homeostasis protein [Streptosporangium becharense]|uniref:PF03932 family protein CutC n=1 Tax=Streptosporangium becharense TaxID=1816182 RepID=A0A7W9MJ56_9ACTN|nr:copper homeostasis protein CutC [Streptosporangium becharense]MBB2911467.1 copper homeostasis protein [Streptosporangium becharense]MBB5822715.1 copper homeostasis protein [Streptosporangium becharense]